MKTPAFVRKLGTALLTKYFRYLLIGTVFAILLVGYFLFLRPQIDIVRDVGISALKNETERYENRKTYLASLQAMLDKYRTIIGQQSVKVTDILPDSPQIGKLFLMLQQISVDNGFSIKAIAVTKGQAQSLATTTASNQKTATNSSALKGVTSTLQVLDVSLVVEGNYDYERFKGYIRSFERSLRLIDVPTLKYQPAPKSTDAQKDQSNPSLSFDLRTYYLESSTP